MRVLIATFTLLLLSSEISVSQQFLTDDAAIVQHRALQVEMWHGKNSSYILPAFQLIQPLQITLGLGFPIDAKNVRRTEAMFQGKALFKKLDVNSFGVGVVAGIWLKISEAQYMINNVYAYIPFSFSFLNDAVVIHQNLGWVAVHEQTTSSFLTWAVRFDVTPIQRITMWSEMFGQGTSSPEYQFGIRGVILHDRLAINISYHGNMNRIV